MTTLTAMVSSSLSRILAMILLVLQGEHYYYVLNLTILEETEHWITDDTFKVVHGLF